MNEKKGNETVQLEDWMEQYRVWYKEYLDTGGNPKTPPPPPPGN